MPFETLDRLALDTLEIKGQHCQSGAVEKTRKVAENPYFDGV